MKIVDTNILNRYAKGDISLDISEPFFTTNDLKEEFESLISTSDSIKNKLQKVRFIDPDKNKKYNEIEYFKNYQILINKYNNLVSFYGMKGLGDVSILTLVATVLNSSPTLFDNNEIEIITNDHDLKIALKTEFNNGIIITDPFEVN